MRFYELLFVIVIKLYDQGNREEFIWAYSCRGIRVVTSGNIVASSRSGSRSKKLTAYVFNHKHNTDRAK